MEFYTLSCEVIEPQKLAIILRLAETNYIVDPMAITALGGPNKDLIMGYMDGMIPHFETVPFIVSWLDESTYELKHYTDSGAESFLVGCEEWARLCSTSLYRLCHSVLFDGEQSIYQENMLNLLRKDDFWRILYGLLIGNLDRRYQQFLIDDLNTKCTFGCYLLSEPEDECQELLFCLGREELKVQFYDYDFEDANLASLRKRMELALNADEFNLGLPNDKVISCYRLNAREYYYSEEEDEWQPVGNDSYKALISVGDEYDMEEKDGIMGACDPGNVIPMLYFRLFDIATRFDRYTNKTGKSYRVQLFSQEIEDYMAAIRRIVAHDSESQ